MWKTSVRIISLNGALFLTRCLGTREFGAVFIPHSGISAGNENGSTKDAKRGQSDRVRSEGVQYKRLLAASERTGGDLGGRSASGRGASRKAHPVVPGSSISRARGRILKRAGFPVFRVP